MLAKHVLEGRTKGYTQHPQLNRFKAADNSLPLIHYYLEEVYKEAMHRNYRFDPSKFEVIEKPSGLTVTVGQLNYEMQHLLNKLQLRDKERYEQIKQLIVVEPHPVFNIIPGDVEDWEIIGSYR